MYTNPVRRQMISSGSPRSPKWPEWRGTSFPTGGLATPGFHDPPQSWRLAPYSSTDRLNGIYLGGKER